MINIIGPFLDVVRSEVVGPITGVALSSINKFLAYVEFTTWNSVRVIQSLCAAGDGLGLGFSLPSILC